MTAYQKDDVKNHLCELDRWNYKASRHEILCSILFPKIVEIILIKQVPTCGYSHWHRLFDVKIAFNFRVLRFGSFIPVTFGLISVIDRKVCSHLLPSIMLSVCGRRNIYQVLANLPLKFTETFILTLAVYLLQSTLNLPNTARDLAQPLVFCGQPSAGPTFPESIHLQAALYGRGPVTLCHAETIYSDMVW